MSEWPSSFVWVICFYGRWRTTSVPSAKIMLSVTSVSWRSFSQCSPCCCLLRELTDRIQVHFGLAEPGQVSIISVNPRGVFLTDSSQHQHVTAVCHNYFNQKLKSINLFFLIYQYYLQTFNFTLLWILQDCFYVCIIIKCFVIWVLNLRRHTFFGIVRRKLLQSCSQSFFFKLSSFSMWYRTLKVKQGISNLSSCYKNNHTNTAFVCVKCPSFRRQLLDCFEHANSQCLVEK